MRNIFISPFTVSDLLTIDFDRKTKSGAQIVKLTNTYNIVKKDSIIGKLLKLINKSEVVTYYKVFKFRVESNSGNVYTALVRISPNFDKIRFLNNKIQVYCTCPDFKYRAAYYLNRYDNLYLNKAIKSELGIALTKKPTVVTTTNLCKHLYAVLHYMQLNINKLGLTK